MIRVTADLREVHRMFDRLQAGMRKVASSTLNRTAFQLAREEWPKIAERELDDPTPFTKKGVQYRKATPQNLTAVVHLSRIQEGYLLPQITGGTARRKKALPATINLNRYGNIPGLRGGSKLKALLAKKDHFRARINGTDAIWRRRGRKLVAVVVFPEPQRVRYQARLDFQGEMRRRAIPLLKRNAEYELRRLVQNAKR